jgi:hypothetical protein
MKVKRAVRRWNPVLKFTTSLVLVLLMLAPFFIPIYGSMIFNSSKASLLGSLVIFVSFFFVVSGAFKSAASIL